LIHTEIIIVGLGIAGTNVALELAKRNIEYIIIDDDNKSAASMAAAGTINPVTGRHYVKSWIFEDLKPAFISTYQDFNSQFGGLFFKQLPIIRAIYSIKEENEWYARCNDPDYKEYITAKANYGDLKNSTIEQFTYGEVTQAYQVQLRGLISTFKKEIIKRGQYYHDNFDYSQLDIGKDKIKYKDIIANKIVFCEGYKVLENPLFAHLPFDPVKGEALIIKMEGGMEKSLRDKIFITPIGDDLYWCGANYVWDYKDHLPTSEGRNLLENQLKEFLIRPYEVVDHLAGVRPSTKSRRPIAQRHEQYANIFILNGLGTKGSSLAPYFAKNLVEMMI
jgi:glycine oxidase